MLRIVFSFIFLVFMGFTVYADSLISVIYADNAVKKQDVPKQQAPLALSLENEGYDLSGLKLEFPPTCIDGYVLNGTECVKEVSVAPQCPEGYTFNGVECSQSLEYPAVCPDGYTLSADGNCELTISEAPQCPDGYTFSGTDCVKTIILDPQCPDGATFDPAQDKCVYANATQKYVFKGSAQGGFSLPAGLEYDATNKKYICYTYYFGTTNKVKADLGKSVVFKDGDYYRTLYCSVAVDNNGNVSGRVYVKNNSNGSLASPVLIFDWFNPDNGQIQVDVTNFACGDIYNKIYSPNSGYSRQCQSSDGKYNWTDSFSNNSFLIDACPDGSVYQNGQCLADVICPDGTFDPAQDKCIFNDHVAAQCPENSSLSANGLCEGFVSNPVVCPENTSFLDGMCKGVISAAVICPTGTSLVDGMCQGIFTAQPQCPDGYFLDTTKMMCIK